MVKVKPLEKVADKWKRKASAATGDYEEGVKNPREDWQARTLAASETWKAGIQQAIANDMFKKGVSKVTTADWQKAAIEKGVARYGTGVAAAVDKYKKNFAPYLEALKAIELPPRGPKGSDQNFERVRIIGKTLHELKVRGT